MLHSESCLSVAGGTYDDECICGADKVNKRPLVIYHGGCADGQGAAAVFFSKYPDAEFYPGTYGKDLPDISRRNVYLLDFSYPRNLVWAMCAEAKSVTIIDHHRSALLDLDDLNVKNLTKVFDMGFSGAVLTWKYLYPEHNFVPLLLQFIQDQDLWRFHFEETRAALAYLYSTDFQIEEWAINLNDEIFRRALPNMLSQGQAIRRQNAKRAKQAAEHYRLINIEGHIVPAVNCGHELASDVGHMLCKGRPFAAVYYDGTDGRKFSLRSDDNGIDVSILAKRLGGGGHQHAAGFTVSFDTAHGYEIK